MSTLKVKVDNEWKEVGSTGSVIAGIAENVEVLNNKVDSIHASNPNLLNNPFFTVNQRGVSTFSDSTYRIVDRWVSNRAEGTIASDGIHFHHQSGYGTNGFIAEFIEDTSCVGKVCTLSAIVDGEIYSFTETFPSTGSVNSGYIFADGKVALQMEKGDYPKLLVYTTSTTDIVVRAVKLELGSFSTLVYDSAPNYADELARCQRYFWKMTGSAYLVAFKRSGTVYSQYIRHPVPMRVTPVVTGMYEYITSDGSWSSAYAINSSHYSGISNTVGLCFQTTYSGFTNFQATHFYLRDVEFSADI